MGIVLPRIMYAVLETRLLPCYFRMESSLDLVSLSLVLDAADYPVLRLLHVIYTRNNILLCHKNHYAKRLRQLVVAV